MALATGTRIGPYEIEAPIGEGGMGQVYRARDSKLHRLVALKILPDKFAADPDRLARFRREAQVLASLNHPNIAAIFGLEDSGATHALVMELVPGTTLNDVIARGPVTLHDALQIARQIALALEAAHEQGIVHRDLKPANVKTTDDGTVKVLDFGLAKALAQDASGPGRAADVQTVTSPALTEIGVILGTAGYMAPEQAKGKPVDRRADLWAFGVVLFEMLSGRALYRGETVTETIAHVITQPPDWSALPASTPSAIRRLLRRCLEKDPRARMQSAGDVRLEIDEYLAAPQESSGTVSPGAVTPASRWRWVPWAISAALVGALVIVAWPKPSPPPDSPARFDVRLGTGEELLVDDNQDGAVAVLSPDGQSLAYLAVRGDARRLIMRRLDKLESAVVADRAMQQFFSPDSRSIAFFADGSLKRVSLGGGATSVVAPAQDPRGGTWGPDNSIVFTSKTETGLSRVSIAGGPVTEITQLKNGERSHRWPSFLPDGSAVLFMSQMRDGTYDDGTIEAVTLATGQRKVLIHGGTFPRYFASGHLLYTRQGTLYAVRFDPKRLEVSGEPQPLVSGIESSGSGSGTARGDGASQYAIADNGTLVYLSGAPAVQTSQLAIVDRDGKIIYAYPERLAFRDPRFSPNGRQIALRVSDNKVDSIYVLDIARDTLTRASLDGTLNLLPVWTPDGQRLAYMSDRSGKGVDVFLTRADASGTPERLTTGGTVVVPMSFTSDGSQLAVFAQTATGDTDLAMISMADRTMKPFMPSPSGELVPVFSPDDKWIAYQSNETGGPETSVFIRAYPGGEHKLQVSSGAGVSPFWTKNGRELIYLTGPPDHCAVMAVDVTFLNGTAQLGKPHKLFELSVFIPTNALWFHPYSDGTKFVALLADTQAARAKQTHVTFVLNFDEDVRRALSAGRK